MTPQTNRTAIMLTFPNLTNEQIAKISQEIEDVIMKYGGQVRSKEHYDTDFGTPVIYQP